MICRQKYLATANVRLDFKKKYFIYSWSYRLGINYTDIIEAFVITNEFNVEDIRKEESVPKIETCKMPTFKR